MTKAQLATILFSRQTQAIVFRSSGGHLYIGFLVSVQKEDGSGSSFNITIRGCDNDLYTFHMRTTD